MTGREDHGTPELAAGGSGKGRTFPDSWGMPEGAPLSEERELWVRSHVQRASITQRFTALEQAQGRLLAIARNAYLDSIEDTP